METITDKNKTKDKEKDEQQSKTVEVLLDPKKSDDAKTTKTVKIKKDNYLKDFVKKSTTKSEETDEQKDTDKNLTVKEFKDKVDAEKKDYENQFTMDDFYNLSELIIEGIDMLFTFLLRWYAKDTADAPYTLRDGRKKKLSSLMVKILVKMNMRFPIAMMFLIALIFAYFTPIKNARVHRNKTINKNKTENANAIDVTDTKTGDRVITNIKKNAGSKAEKPRNIKKDKPLDNIDKIPSRKVSIKPKKK